MHVIDPPSFNHAHSTAIDDALFPLISIVENVVATRARVPVLSLWKRIA